MADVATTYEAIDPRSVSGEVLPPPPETKPACLPIKRRKHIKLNTVDDIKVELAKLYRAARAGELATSDASRLTFMLHSLARIIEVADLERRITELEETA